MNGGPSSRKWVIVHCSTLYGRVGKLGVDIGQRGKLNGNRHKDLIRFHEVLTCCEDRLFRFVLT